MNYLQFIGLQDVNVGVIRFIILMNESQIGHIRPHLKGSGDFTIDVRFAHFRRVFANFVSQLFLGPTTSCNKISQ